MLREIQPTLGPGAQGPDVANLQEALIALGDSGYFRSSDPPIPYEPAPPPGGPTLQPTPDQLSQFLKVVADRRRFQTYESATETVVAWFQAQAILTDPPGVVEAATARRLNVELRERRLFPEGYQHGIVGQVRRLSDGDPMVDILVRAFLLTPANVPIPLGDTYTDPAGAYAIPLDAATLVAAVPPGAAMPFLVQVFDDNGKLIAKTQQDAPPDDALTRMDVEVAGGDGALDTPQPGAPDPDLPRPDPGTPPWPGLPECDAGDYLVEGRVVDEQGRGLACVAVWLFEEDLSASTILAGPVNTTAEGHYRFSFSPGVYRDGDVGLLPRSSPQPQPPEWWRAAVVQPAAPLPVLSGPDLWVGLGTDAASITTRTGIVFNAGLRTQMPDLVLTKASLHAGLSDLERVMGLVGPRLKGVSPAALSEQQISFLASDCEEPIALIQALVAAGRSLEQAESLAAQLGLPWPGGQTSQILAGLQFTAAVEHALATLEQQLLLSDSDILSTLQYGMVRNRIPSHPDPAIESFVAWFAAFREKRNEAERAPTLDDRYVQSPDDLFAIGWPEDPESLQLLKARATDIARWMDDPNLRKAGSRQRFIDDLALPSDLAAPLHSLLRLNVLLGGQRALLQSLWPEITNHQVSEPLIALAGWEVLDWINAVHTAGDERSLGVDPSSFGRRIALQAEALMPAPTLRRQLADNVIFQERPFYHDLAGRLSEHPDLDLMDERPEALAERLDLTEQQVAVLTGLRQFKLADWSWEETAQAVAVNITSVDDVIRVGKDGVTRRLNKDGSDVAIDPLAIERLHGAATHVAGQAAGFLAVTMTSSNPVFASSSPFTPGWGTGTPAADEDDDPTIRRILQLDACACDPCLSMLSPAAYRTDLLRFLEVSVDDDEWFERRLGSARDLLLSCDNSRIEKCQLDLAIERMENRLVFSFPVVLATGQQPAQQVQAPNLGSELRTALRSTTDLNDAQFGPFSVIREASPNATPAMGTTWLITDPARHWRVRALAEQLSGADPSNRVAAAVNVVPLLAALNSGGVVNLASLAELLPVIRRAIGCARLPLAVSRVEVTGREERSNGLMAWRLQVTAEGQLDVSKPIQRSIKYEPMILVFTSAAGGSPARCELRRSPYASVQDFNQGFLNPINRTGRLPATVSSDLSLHGDPPVLQPLAGNSTGWRYTISRSIEILHRPARFEVLSLTYQSTPDLDGAAVEPVHRNAKAYDTHLGQKTYPWSLPFDESTNHARALLRASGLERRALQEACQLEEQWVNSEAWVQEVLGLSAKAVDHLCADLQDPVLFSTWGLKPSGSAFSVVDGERSRQGSGAALLARVAVVMHQARLSFAELRLLLTSRHLNPNGAVTITPEQGCDPFQMTFAVASGYSIQEFCRRLYRFVQLQRALVWPCHELDAALQRVLGSLQQPVSATDWRTTLRILAHLQVLSRILQVTPDVLADWLGKDFSLDAGTLDGGEGRLETVLTPYERTFQNPAVQNPPDPRLRPGAFQASGSNSPAHTLAFEDLQKPLAAALGLRTSALLEWRKARIPDLEASALASLDTTQNGVVQRLQRGEMGLLALWRNVQLAGALDLDLADYAAATRLLGPSPFRFSGTLPATIASGTSALLGWCGVVAAVRKRGLRFDALEEILTAPWLLSRTEAAATLTSLQEGLRSAPAFAATPITPLLFGQGVWPPAIHASSEHRWRHWGLQQDTNATQWMAVEPMDPLDPTRPSQQLLDRDPLALLKQLRVLGWKLGRPIGQVRALLETRFVTGTVDPDIKRSTADQIWRAQALIPEHLDRLQAMDQLQAATQLSPMLLDLALDVWSGLTPDMRAKELAALVSLAERTGLEHDRLIAFWSGFSGRSYNSYSDGDPSQPADTTSLFQRLIPTSASSWTLNANRTGLSSPPTHWLDPQASRQLAKALKVEHTELAALVEHDATLPAPQLNSLKEVHRWLTLARVLRLPLRILKTYQAHIQSNWSQAADPFASPTVLAGFLDQVEHVRPRAGLIIERLSVMAGLEQPLTAHLLAVVLRQPGGAISPSALEHFLAAAFSATTTRFEPATVTGTAEHPLLLALLRFGRFNSSWKFDGRTMHWLPSPGNGGLDLLNPSDLAQPSSALSRDFSRWHATSALLELLQKQPALVAVLDDYRTQRIRPSDPQSMTEAMSILARAFGFETTFASQLATRVGLVANTSRNPANLTACLRLLITCQQLGMVDITSLQELLDLPAPNTSSRAAQAARAVVFARHGAEGVASILEEAARTVRIDRRDRLVDYLVWRDNLPSAEHLVEHLLTDPLQSDARRTTRELHEIATTQMALNLCLMGQEQGISPDRFDPVRAQVMRSRVVRNANLEVLLFPYRYMGFSVDKSAAFLDFVDELGQDEATLPNVHLAMRRYFNNLVSLSNLKVVSMHITRDRRDRRVLYQLGRTRSQPYEHYWRTCQRYQQAGMHWTGWQKIDIPIDGEWPLIFVFEDIPHVVWPILSEAKKNGESFIPRWNLQIAGMRFESGRWSRRRLSNEAQFDGVVGLEASRSIFVDIAALPSPQLRIYKIVNDSAQFTLNPSRPSTPGIEGPHWEVDKLPAGWKRMDSNSIRDRTFVISVELTAWVKYTWTDSSTGSQTRRTHYAPMPFVTVNIILARHSKPSGSNTIISIPWPDAATGRWAANFLYDSNFYQGVDIDEVTIMVWWGEKPALVFKSTEKIPVGNTFEYGFVVKAEFESSEEPPEARRARSGNSLSGWRTVSFGADGSIAIEQEDSAPQAVDYKPTTMLAVGNRFLENNSAAVSEVAIQPAIQGDGLPILGQTSGAAINRSGNNLELVRASFGWLESSANIWWLDEGNAAGLVDASPSTPSAPASISALSAPRLIPSSTLPLKELLKTSDEVPGLITDPKKWLEAKSLIVPAWVEHYLPSNLPASRNPINISNPAVDLRFIHARDCRELQLDVPWAAASIASQQQRHDVARELLRLLYDPWSTNSQRRWPYLPISEAARPLSRRQFFEALRDPNADPETRRQAQLQVFLAFDEPFNPSNLLRLRPAEVRTAIGAETVRTQGALGDGLFLQFTNESIDRARLHYLTMAKMLGPRPEPVPSRVRPTPPKSYRQLVASQGGSSPLIAGIALGSTFPSALTFAPTPELKSDQEAAVAQMLSLTSGYFCLPTDDSLLELWDLAADRLHKLRNGMNIHGVEQALPLLDPPIDPAVLIRATQAGISIDDALSDLYAPPSHLRFQARLALAQEVIAASLPLASAAWAAKEEADSERLTLMRADHELALLRLTEKIRADEVNEANANIEALKQEAETLRQEIQFLNLQLGKETLGEDSEQVPIVDGSLMVKVVQGGMGLSGREVNQLSRLSQAQEHGQLSSQIRTVAHVYHAFAALVPEPLGKGPVTALAHGAEAVAEVLSGLSAIDNTHEKLEGIMAGFERRHDQVKQEMLSRVSRMRENRKRLAAAEIRCAIAKRNQAHLLQDIDQKRQEQEFLQTGKFATEAVKLWAGKRSYELTHGGFQLSVEQTLLTWQAMRNECGNSSLPPPDTRSWDPRYLGRFALESLQQSLLRMKVAYESRPPELELTVNLSLRQLDPQQLVELRYKGSCTFEVTEFHLNRFMPCALYFQRLKTISISIPCVVGPYTGVHAKLTILSNQYRHSDRVLGGNLMAAENFRTATLPRTTFLTSTAQNDSGMFEVNLRAEQLLVGECAGLALCRIKLELPERPPFDYLTIQDLVLHLRFTAKEVTNPSLKQALAATKPPVLPGQSLLLSCRSDFATAWHMGKQSGTDTATLPMDDSLLPYSLVHALNEPSPTIKLRKISYLDIPAQPSSLNWKNASETGSSVAIPSSLKLPFEVTTTNFLSLDDRLLLLVFN